MTSIKKDLRELAREAANKLWSARGVHFGTPSSDEEWGRILNRMSLIIESVFRPWIVAAVEQAQADAIRAAHAAFQDEYCNHDGMAIGLIRGLKAILAITPRRVQIEAELREATIRIQEMQWWHDNPAANKSVARHKRLQGQYVFIATLERELEAERKGVAK